MSLNNLNDLKRIAHKTVRDSISSVSSANGDCIIDLIQFDARFRANYIIEVKEQSTDNSVTTITDICKCTVEIANGKIQRITNGNVVSGNVESAVKITDSENLRNLQLLIDGKGSTKKTYSVNVAMEVLDDPNNSVTLLMTTAIDQTINTSNAYIITNGVVDINPDRIVKLDNTIGGDVITTSPSSITIAGDNTSIDADIKDAHITFLDDTDITSSNYLNISGKSMNFYASDNIDIESTMTRINGLTDLKLSSGRDTFVNADSSITLDSPITKINSSDNKASVSVFSDDIIGNQSASVIIDAPNITTSASIIRLFSNDTIYVNATNDARINSKLIEFHTPNKSASIQIENTNSGEIAVSANKVTTTARNEAIIGVNASHGFVANNTDLTLRLNNSNAIQINQKVTNINGQPSSITAIKTHESFLFEAPYAVIGNDSSSSTNYGLAFNGNTVKLSVATVPGEAIARYNVLEFNKTINNNVVTPTLRIDRLNTTIEHNTNTIIKGNLIVSNESTQVSFMNSNINMNSNKIAIFTNNNLNLNSKANLSIVGNNISISTDNGFQSLNKSIQINGPTTFIGPNVRFNNPDISIYDNVKNKSVLGYAIETIPNSQSGVSDEWYKYTFGPNTSIVFSGRVTMDGNFNQIFNSPVYFGNIATFQSDIVLTKDGIGEYGRINENTANIASKVIHIGPANFGVRIDNRDPEEIGSLTGGAGFGPVMCVGRVDGSHIRIQQGINKAPNGTITNSGKGHIDFFANQIQHIGINGNNAAYFQTNEIRVNKITTTPGSESIVNVNVNDVYFNANIHAVNISTDSFIGNNVTVKKALYSNGIYNANCIFSDDATISSNIIGGNMTINDSIKAPNIQAKQSLHVNAWTVTEETNGDLIFSR